MTRPDRWKNALAETLGGTWRRQQIRHYRLDAAREQSFGAAVCRLRVIPLTTMGEETRWAKKGVGKSEIVGL